MRVQKVHVTSDFLHACIAMEYVSGGDLHSYLERRVAKGVASLDLVRHLLWQLVAVIEHAHSLGASGAVGAEGGGVCMLGPCFHDQFIRGGVSGDCTHVPAGTGYTGTCASSDTGIGSIGIFCLSLPARVGLSHTLCPPRCRDP